MNQRRPAYYSNQPGLQQFADLFSEIARNIDFPEISDETLMDYHYTVVDASNPQVVVSPIPLTPEQAHDLAWDLNHDCLGVTFIVVDLDDLEAES